MRNCWNLIFPFFCKIPICRPDIWSLWNKFAKILHTIHLSRNVKAKYGEKIFFKIKSVLRGRISSSRNKYIANRRRRVIVNLSSLTWPCYLEHIQCHALVGAGRIFAKASRTSLEIWRIFQTLPEPVFHLFIR